MRPVFKRHSNSLQQEPTLTLTAGRVAQRQTTNALATSTGSNRELLTWRASRAGLGHVLTFTSKNTWTGPGQMLDVARYSSEAC